MIPGRIHLFVQVKSWYLQASILYSGILYLYLYLSTYLIHLLIFYSSTDWSSFLPSLSLVSLPILLILSLRLLPSTASTHPPIHLFIYYFVIHLFPSVHLHVFIYALIHLYIPSFIFYSSSIHLSTPFHILLLELSGLYPVLTALSERPVVVCSVASVPSNSATLWTVAWLLCS